MKRFIWLAPLLIMVLSLSIVSCKKDDGPVVPITLKVLKPEQIPVKNDMNFKAHFILNGKVTKSLDVKLGDNKIEIPKANYSNVIVTSHDFSDYSNKSIPYLKYPEVLTRPQMGNHLPRYSTRIILHGENGETDLKNKNEVSVALKSPYKLVMVKLNDVISKWPYIQWYSEYESFKQVTDDKGQKWLATYVYNPVNNSTSFIIGVKLDNNKTREFTVTEEIQPSTVMQFTFDRYARYTKETLEYKDYDHVNVMSTTPDWVLY